MEYWKAISTATKLEVCQPFDGCGETIASQLLETVSLGQVVVIHFIDRLHVQLVILEGIGHAVDLPGRLDPESHDLSVPVDFTERAGGSPLM